MGIQNILTTISASAYSIAVSKSAIDKTINDFLSYDDGKTFNANSILHWSIELSSSASQYGRTTGGTITLDSLVFGGAFQNSEVEEFINKLNAAVCIPNLEGIPIFAAKCSTGRDIMLSEQNLILPAGDLPISAGDLNVPASVNNGAVKRGIYVDNAVPRLRTWSISGYIISILPVLDYRSQVKPSILLEMDYLDAIAKSGKPVWFKTHTNEFVRVQLQNFNFEFTPEINTGVAVSFTLKEYAPMRITTYAPGNAATEQVSEKEVPAA